MNKIYSMNMYQKVALTVAAAFAMVVTLAATAPSVQAFDFGGFGGFGGTVHTCSITVDRSQVHAGEGVAVTWNATGFTNITVNGQSVSQTGTWHITNVQEDQQYVLHATDGEGNTCDQTVHVDCLPPVVGHCALTLQKSVNKTTAVPGDILTYTITIKNTGDANCTGGGVRIEDPVNSHLSYENSSVSDNLTKGYDGHPVYDGGVLYFNGGTLEPGEVGTITWTGRVQTPASCGDFSIPNKARATALELNNFGTWSDSNTVSTSVSNGCPHPAPTCDAFSASPSTINAGGTSTLTWATTNAASVSINNNVGSVAVDGSKSVSPANSTTYTLTATGAGGTVTCTTTVHVQSVTPAPTCDAFSASPSVITSGSSSTLSWNTTNATSVSISGIGGVAVDGTRLVSPTGNTTYTLTATGAGGTATCTTTVQVNNPAVFSCANNVSFTASDYSIRKGSNTTLTWSTTNVDSVSIDVINKTSLSGNETVSPSNDTTYTLTAKKGTETITCPLTVNVSSGGGGGGGSLVPRCRLTASQSTTHSGDTIKLTWDTSNATDLTLKDDHGKVLFTTDDYRSSDRSDYYDYSIKVTPTRDTKYTLHVERGSRDEDCTVKVKVDENGGVTLLQDRDQQPLVAGIALSNVPYTGFEAGTALTIMFYMLLASWALYITYLFVVRRNVATIGAAAMFSEETSGMASMRQAVAARPDVFPVSVATNTTAPTNLPTMELVADSVAAAGIHQVDASVATELENRAHAQHALLSSDAIRYFVGAIAAAAHTEQIDRVVAEARKTYPLEEGWVVINEDRMRALVAACSIPTVAAEGFAPTVVPEGAGSLAEAIVTGNIIAAYELVGNRPMFALADAAADLDALYRQRKGGVVSISGLLTSGAASLSNEQILAMIGALTSALDGVYQDEASAVKMAIMKAIKIAA